MDFDEYEYLEKTVENPQPQKAKESTNGNDENVTSEEKRHSRSSRHRGDEKLDNNDDKSSSKRSRHGDESRDREREKDRSHNSRSGDRERHRETGGREHKDREKDRDLDGDRDKKEINGRERGKDRNRDRDVTREPERERERGREREKEKEKDREIDVERRRERSRRSRSRSERQPAEREERDREKSKERDNRGEERERELRDGVRDTRRFKKKKEDGDEPEVDPERDQRTVFAYQICLKATERDVYEFFSRAGKVRDVRLIMDRISRRSKGVGYVEFYDSMSVPMAIALSGQPLLGVPVMVKPSEAEKNLVQPTPSMAGSSGLVGSGGRKLYVGNLHYNMTEEDLGKVFEPFGTVELVQLPRDETGQCKGFGFVQFARLEDAKNALNLNEQLEIAGRMIKVSAITDQTVPQEGGQNTGDFDDDEGGGLALNAQSRALLMQKLDRSGNTSSNGNGLPLPPPPSFGAPGVSPLVAPFMQGSVPGVGGLPGAGLQFPGVAVPPIDPVGTPSECLLLKNMFDPKLETEPDFDFDIKEDVQDECSKYGTVKHIHVDKNTAGFVYLRFDNAQSAMSAQRALHGRWFAGKMITATFMFPETYEAKFKDSIRQTP